MDKRKVYIRGYFIPKFDPKNSKFFNYEDITLKIGILEEYFKELIKVFQYFFKEKISNISDLKKLNDLYVLLTYSALSKPWENMVFTWLNQFKKKKNEIESFKNEILPSFYEITRKFYELFPADDRPGLNTSSLLIHAISTSALATCLFIDERGDKIIDSKDYQIIRTSSFFHDIGKPFSKKNHVSMSVELFKKYFNEILSDDLLNPILSNIEQHHNDKVSGLSRYIRLGDRLSSASDRLQSLVKSTLSGLIEGLDENFDKHDFWEKNEEKIAELTKIFLERVENQNLKFNEEENLDFEKPSGQIALIRGDVRKIHDYIDNVNTMAELRNSSSLLDYILTTHLVNKLLEEEKLGINPENIIYSSGGNTLIFSCGKFAEQIARFIEEEFYNAMKGGLTLYADYIFFDYDYKGTFGDLYDKLALKMGFKKNNLINFRNNPVILGFSKLCNSCGKALATIEIKFPDEEKTLKYCEKCEFKRNLKGSITEISELTLQKRWESDLTPKYENILKSYDWDIVGPFLMEFISGISLDDIVKHKTLGKTLPSSKVAIINADGNLAGEFISKANSLSDLYERIIHISNSIIESFDEILDSIKEMGNVEDCIRLELGKVYMGGDDLLIITPGYLAIPISLILMKKFYIKMGGKLTLSSGIFLCPPKYPVWHGIESAGRLLNISAKRVGRNLLHDEFGAIDLQSFSLGISLPEKEEMELYLKRPFKLKYNHGEGDLDEFHFLLKQILGQDFPLNTNIRSTYENLFQFIYDEKAKNYKSNSRLRDFRNVVRRFLSFFMGNIEDLEENRYRAIAYALYQVSRQKNISKRQIYMNIFNLLGGLDFDKYFLIISSIELIRFLSGGII